MLSLMRFLHELDRRFCHLTVDVVLLGSLQRLHVRHRFHLYCCHLTTSQHCHNWHMFRQDTPLSILSFNIEDGCIYLFIYTVWCHDAAMNHTHFSDSAFLTTSSIVPTLRNAASGKSSYFPSRISLKLLTVSATGT